MKRTNIFLLYVVATLLMRVLPHPFNFTPALGLVFASGMMGVRPAFASVVLFMMMYCSDLIINNLIYPGIDGFVWAHEGFYWSYITLAAICTGSFLFSNKLSGFTGKLTGIISSSLLFFVVTNFGVWLTSGMYPQTWEGLVSCFGLALPFYQYSIAGDLVWFFGIIYSFSWLTSFQSQAITKEV